MKDISIIIVSYNTKELTLACIDSIKRQEGKPEKEIIVVDNNSKDSSVKELEKLKKKDKDFILIKNKDNLGFSKANNQGIEIARGKKILLLNSDTEIKKGAIRKLVDFADKHPEAGVVGSRLLNADGSIQESCVHFPSIKNAVLEYWFGKKGLFEKYAPKGKEPKEVDAVVGASFLITEKALEKVGKLDERYFFYFEDIDYCRKVKKAGLKVYYLPASEVIHYHGASGKKLADEKNQWRRLIPSSKIYHGLLKHYLITSILWLGQKWQKLTKK